MKTRLAAALVAVATAFGLGAGIAQAAESPAPEVPSTPGIHLTMPTIDLNTEVPANLPSSSDIVDFLAKSITLAGRDILRDSPSETVTASLLNTLADENPAPVANKSGLNKAGDNFDGFWAGIGTNLGKIPGLGQYLEKGVDGLRDNKAWESDPFRIMFTLGIFLVPLGAPAGLVLGGVSAFLLAVTAAIAVFSVIVVPAGAIGIFGGAVAGLFAAGAGFLTGISILFWTGLFGLLFFGGGIALIASGLALGWTGAGLIVAIVAGVVLILLSPLFLIPIGTALAAIFGSLAGAIALVIAGALVMLVPAMVIALIAAGIAFVVVLVASGAVLIPAGVITGFALGIGSLIAALVTLIAMGRTRPAGEPSPVAAKKAAAENKDSAPAPAPAPAPASVKAVRSEYALAA